MLRTTSAPIWSRSDQAEASRRVVRGEIGDPALLAAGARRAAVEQRDVAHVLRGRGIDVAVFAHRQDLRHRHVVPVAPPVRQCAQQCRRLPDAGRHDDAIAVADAVDGRLGAETLASVELDERHGGVRCTTVWSRRRSTLDDGRRSGQAREFLEPLPGRRPAGFPSGGPASPRRRSRRDERPMLCDIVPEVGEGRAATCHQHLLEALELVARAEELVAPGIAWLACCRVAWACCEVLTTCVALWSISADLGGLVTEVGDGVGRIHGSFPISGRPGSPGPGRWSLRDPRPPPGSAATAWQAAVVRGLQGFAAALQPGRRARAPTARHAGGRLQQEGQRAHRHQRGERHAAGGHQEHGGDADDRPQQAQVRPGGGPMLATCRDANFA